MAKGVNRDRTRESRWRRILREHARSGLTVREFCRRGKLTETAFYYWRRELRHRRAEQEQRRPELAGSQTPAFLPVRIQEQPIASSGGWIEVELAGGRRVRVVGPIDRQALTDVLAVVEGLPCEASTTEGRSC